MLQHLKLPIIRSHIAEPHRVTLPPPSEPTGNASSFASTHAGVFTAAFRTFRFCRVDCANAGRSAVVLFLSYNFHVRGVNAFTIPAEMIYRQSGGNRAALDLPHVPVSQYCLALRFCAGEHEYSISRVAMRSGPSPTAVRLLNLCPESLGRSHLAHSRRETYTEPV
jgi:hypothetical protein